MLTIVAEIVGESPYSQSAPIQSKKKTGESPDAFEERTWKERAHLDENGDMFIPAPSIKNCLAEVAKYLSESVPGKNKATYTKHFEAGIIVADNVTLKGSGKTIIGERLFVPASGKRGDGKRVWRTFPTIPAGWSGTVRIMLLDPILVDKPEKVVEYLTHAGKFIGLGRFRPRNNGYYGRFSVKSWRTEKLAG